MNISVNFKKKPWVRRVHPDKANGTFRMNYRPIPGRSLTDAFIELTASDFLNELSPAAHPINSRYMSTRPIWKPTGKKDENGKEEWMIDGYDELESVALGWQQFICGNKIAHLTGDGGFELANETTDQETYETLLSWMDSSGLRDAYAEAVYYCERAGDSGIMLRLTQDGEIEYTVYATEKGHTIYPQEDEKGNSVYYVQYWKNNQEFCDIISTGGIETWVHADESKDENAGFFEAIWNRLVVRATKEMSDDGWTLVRRSANQVGDDMCEFTYFIVPDTSWGPAELSCEAHENAASYVANEVKDSAFPLLVLKSEKVSNLPPSEINGKTIAIKGTSDSLAHSDVKFAAPPDASNIATIHFKELANNIIRTTQTAIIEPEILKQGADSSTSIKILFRPEIEWAQQRWIFYVGPVRHMVKVFKRLVGKVEGDIAKFGDLRTSVWQSIWVPQNEQEQTKIVLDKVYARVLSRKAAMNELGLQYKGDYAVINKEWEDEIRMKAEIPAEAKAKYGVDGGGGDEPKDNPGDVTNQASGKSIQD